MFEEKDYFMKMIKEFTTAIGRIMGLKAENKIEESQEVLSETLKYFTDLSMEVIEALPYEILIHKVSGSRQINTEKYLMLDNPKTNPPVDLPHRSIATYKTAYLWNIRR